MLAGIGGVVTNRRAEATLKEGVVGEGEGEEDGEMHCDVGAFPSGSGPVP